MPKSPTALPRAPDLTTRSRGAMFRYHSDEVGSV